MEELIRLSKSYIDEDEVKKVTEVLQASYLGMGKYVIEFEEKLSEYFSRDVVCVSTGTAALHLALQAHDISDDDEVIVPSLTYLASYQAISAVNAIPVSCDIDRNNFIISPEDVKRRITENTKAIMPVLYAGGYGKIEEIYKIADENNLRVIEDAAHAFGSMHKGRNIGSFGDTVCFSFDGIKNITSGEGGCITSENKKYIEKIKDLRLLGVKNDSLKRACGERTWTPEVEEQGWRYHMSNIMAAIGIAQLKKKDYLFEQRRNIAKYYTKKLKHLDIFIPENNFDDVVPHIYPILIHEHRNRENLFNYFRELKIEIGYHYYPNHLLKKYENTASMPLEVTEKIWSKLVSLPLHPGMVRSDVDKVCEALESYIGK